MTELVFISFGTLEELKGTAHISLS